MSCFNKKSCNCSFNTKSYGLCDTSKITINGSDKTALNWSEISIPEILCVPTQKPDIENIDQVYVNTDLTSVKLIETPLAYDEYEILATADQIADLLAALTDVTALTTDLNTIVTQLTAILNTVGLQALGLPIITTLNNLLISLTTEIAALTAAVAAATAILVAPVTLEAICAAMTSVIASLTAIIATLTILPGLLNQLVAAVNAIAPAIGAIIAPLVTTLNALVTTTLADAQAALVALQALLTFCANATIVIVIKPNAEGTCLSGRKLIIEGTLNQKIVYTANVDIQSVHSAHYMMPFSAYIIPYANFENAVFTEDVPVLINGVVTTVDGFVTGTGNLIPNLCEEFCVTECVEDIFAYALDARTIFKNITLFLYAKVARQCS